MKTYMAKAETVERKWYVVDATGVPLGRLASKVAAILRGKNKPTFTPNVDTGDFVIVLNTDKVVLTAKSLTINFTDITPATSAVLKKYPIKNCLRKRATSPYTKRFAVCFPKTRSAEI